MDESTKKTFHKVKEFAKNKKVQWILVTLIFLFILISSTTIRLSNLPLLVDHTTGNYTLSDPDALYWMRLEMHLLQYGNLNGIDTMRFPSLNLTYSHEMLVYVVADAYKFISSFNNTITFQYLDAVYPAYAFAISLIIFFFLIYFLTKSKTAATIASAFLAYSPLYLFRTITGVSGHEALGMMFMFAIFLIFVIGLKKFHKNWKQTILWSVLLGIFTAFSDAAWAGSVNFILLIISLAFMIYYLFNIEEENFKLKNKLVAFYLIWLVFSMLSTYLVHYTPSYLLSTLFNIPGIFVLAIFAFIAIDSVLSRRKKFEKSKSRWIWSLIATAVVGLLFEIVYQRGFGIIQKIYILLLHPLGLGRAALTVAYYAQPYLTDLISQSMPTLFWLFMLGIGAVFIELVRGVKARKHKIYLALLGIVSVIGILFSRYSSTGLLDGVNFLSQAIYFLSFAAIIIFFGWRYYKDRSKISEEMIFIFCWMLIMLITGRIAVRTLFMVVTFMSFAGAYLLVKTLEYTKEAKDQLLKFCLGVILAIAIILSLIYLFGNPLNQTAGAYTISASQATQVGPLTNDQWQNAMAWVRNNTANNSIFASWWDYGYLIQTIGLRATVLDGSNYNVYWDHLMGRYVLTTPNPDSALAFMKAQNASYLLIDFTDFGKYPAYASIGSNNNGTDRFASPTLVVADPTQDYKTNGTTIRSYQGTTFVDQDIIYNGLFLPGVVNQSGRIVYNAYEIGVIMNYSTDNSTISIRQPSAVFLYNGQQYAVPMRYVYYDNQMTDFGSGINATFMLIPNINYQNNQISVDPIGAGIYLSPVVQDSLYARLYLMNDPYNQYPTITQGVYEENDIINLLRSKGYNIGEFAYFQGQLVAPLKIWHVSIPSNILLRTEFTNPTGDYAGLDNLTLTD